MICPGCQRDNRANRRYCGACGCNLEPACGACGFVNDRDDRFCGGCGSSMSAAGVQPLAGAVLAPHPAGHAPAGGGHVAAAATAAPAAPLPYAAPPSQVPAPPHASRTTQSMPWPVDELAGLFTPQVVPAAGGPALPEIGIAQDDLDRLFGVES